MAQNMLYLPSLGGANKVTRTLMEGLAAKGHKCQAVAPATGSHGLRTREAFEEEMQARGKRVEWRGEGVCVFEEKNVKVHAVVDRLELGREVRRQSNEFRPDITVVSSQDPGQVVLEGAMECCPGSVVYVAQAPWDLPFGRGTV
ncbi:MAG: hypothetical protein ACREAC_00540, partial [Blastocatellia bacterium]